MNSGELGLFWLSWAQVPMDLFLSMWGCLLLNQECLFLVSCWLFLHLRSISFYRLCIFCNDRLSDRMCCNCRDSMATSFLNFATNDLWSVITCILWQSSSGEIFPQYGVHLLLLFLCYCNVSSVWKALACECFGLRIVLSSAVCWTVHSVFYL